jgi:alkyl sulfatase BDS1-like metallo-beta-lactamase superfamily hydrolase
MGGPSAVLARARAAFEAADYRWAAQILNHLVFAEPENGEAKTLLAAVYTQMGFQSESGVWRNVYLTGAQELVHGVRKGVQNTVAFDMIRATTTPMLLDFLAVRINGERARGHTLAINLELTDFCETHLISLANAALVHEAGVREPGASANLKLRRADFLALAFGFVKIEDRVASGDVVVEGDLDAVATLFSLVDPLDPHFNVVTP